MRILQVVMNMDYGGVESYVARLSRALARLGHEGTVLSVGGAMEKPLREFGIETIRASLKQSDLPDVRTLLGGRRFDIINGHNYNSARVAHSISKWTGTPYVMTVHGPRSFLKRITYAHWSPRVITIGDADTRCISGFLGISRDRIDRSFLPVDLDRNRPQSVPDNLSGELLPDDDAKLIVHISRFTNRTARVALELMKAMPAILKRCPSARLLIAGTGECSDKIAAAAKALDGSCAGAVRVDGPRDDVHYLLNLASVVVATATTAIEALACGAPLIAAGRTGYFGPVDRGNFDSALDLLFADHGRCPRNTTAVVLASDIVAMIDDHDHWRVEAAEVSKRVRAELTPERAALDVLRTYERAASGRSE